MIQKHRTEFMSKMFIADDWQPLLRAQRLDTVEGLWSHTGGKIVKSAPSTEVRRLEVDGRQLYLKKYWVTHPNQLLSGIARGVLFGRSKVRREYENLARLRDWGLDAPAPVAYGEVRRAGWLVRSVLVSEGIAQPLPLDEFIRNQLPLQPSLRDVLIGRLADYVRCLHEHNFAHQDLYWRNIILNGTSLEHFHLIDAHKSRCWSAANELPCRAQDLATLDAPAPWFFRRSERLRFYLRYIGHNKLADHDKQLIRLALQIAGPLRERQLRRIREAHR